ncbi:MAG: hypothetical protein A3F31_02620 [Candidatus Levybacteria bacterium RIFCSPHIGHO2_12_FULL_38_12]|nr:MAG: hypothetical protein A2770_04965 [Candidatus Levybacteria bacterium RIFCSPHIGHO2_01_FULL_38_12]OGH22285.1 MAG: hypothetical protein A3F31_02620 [Candidatus Levybacteria bacterium RIFCSPHIGHO2_12_FULL_38_12]OGH44225.1 MAG: hypothetical protein A3J14_01585 [Candidatus Levybacteria bacterium RIFCSPLOWO2_02_FULL_37_18]OGH51456.1 MAG: hypothetical protein A3G13_02575 [Candidatus Levybacteria bacterium RIFCSPLOWO2_12_FULL_37_7]
MKKIITPISIILFAVLLRLLPHPPNFAPIAGMALFGGVYLNKKYALIVPLLAMFVSDLFIGFHSTILFVYGSFLLTGLIGLWIRQHKSIQNVILGTLASSVLFFIITNFGVWLVGSLYPKTLQGLVQCYVYALPFFRNTILGDLFYTGVFFGSYEFIKNVILISIRDPYRFLIKSGMTRKNDKTKN